MTWAGFDAHTTDVGGTRVHAVVRGDGPPVLLVHGYPQSHEMWARVAPALASEFRVVAVDLPGYGRSDAPTAGPERYAKRRLGEDLCAVMDGLGASRFLMVGHDRGGRVAYRLAFDSPERVAALGVLDIVPTGAVWDGFDAARAMRYYHWAFLAQPEPLPETLIGHDPQSYLHTTLASWTKAGDLSAFAPDAMAAYEKAFCDPAHLSAMCMDYRAGATVDWTHDRETQAAGRRLSMPVQVLWGRHFAAGGSQFPLDVWRDWADDVVGGDVDAGHFVCEERPDEVLAHLQPFLRRHARLI